MDDFDSSMKKIIDYLENGHTEAGEKELRKIDLDNLEDHQKVKFHERQSRIEESKGNLEASIASLNQGLELIEEKNLDLKHEQVDLLDRLGWQHYWNADWTSALNVFEDVIKLATEINDQSGLAGGLNIAGTIYMQKSHLGKAATYFEKAISLFQNLNQPAAVAVVISNLGYLNSLKGDVIGAKKLFDKTLEIMENNKIQAHPWINFNLGSTEYELGNWKNAVGFFKESLAVFGKMKNHSSVGLQLNSIISAYLNLNDLENAKKYHSELEEYHSKYPTDHVKWSLKYATAIYNKAQPRNRNKVMAEQLFHEIINSEEISDNTFIFSTKIPAMKHLVDILLQELKLYGTEEVLQEIIALIGTMYNLGVEQRLHSLLAESTIMNAKMSAVQGNLDAAIDMLDEVVMLTKEHGLERLIIMAEREVNSIRKDYDEMKKFVEDNPILSERVAKSELIDYIQSALKLSS